MEIRDIRCCMCPQINSDNCICPIGPGKSEETPCDFVVVWIVGNPLTRGGIRMINIKDGNVCGRWNGVIPLTRRKRI